MSQISEYVEAMFSTLPRTKDVNETKLNIIEGLEEKFDALLEEGKSEYEALGMVIAHFGNVDEIRRELGIEETAGSFSAQEEQIGRLQRDYFAFRSKAYMGRAAAVTLFILSPFIGYESDSALLFFAMIAAGVSLLIYYNGRLDDYARLLEDAHAGLLYPCTRGEPDLLYEPPAVSKAPPIGRPRWMLYLIITLTTLIVYLFVGAAFDLWHPAWILFLFIPLAISVLELIRYEDKPNRKEK